MKYLLICFLISPTILFGQFDTVVVDTATNRIVFTDIVKVDSASKKVLYTNAKIWFANTFKSSNHVIQLDDPESGILIGKGYTVIQIETGVGLMDVNLYFTLKVHVKEGRYKFTSSDLYYHFPASYTGTTYSPVREVFIEDFLTPNNLYKKNGEMRPMKGQYYYATLEAVNSLFNRLKDSMTSKIDSKEDW